MGRAAAEAEGRRLADQIRPLQVRGGHAATTARFAVAGSVAGAAGCRRRERGATRAAVRRRSTITTPAVSILPSRHVPSPSRVVRREHLSDTARLDEEEITRQLAIEGVSAAWSPTKCRTTPAFAPGRRRSRARGPSADRRASPTRTRACARVVIVGAASEAGAMDPGAPRIHLQAVCRPADACVAAAAARWARVVAPARTRGDRRPSRAGGSSE